MQVLSFPFTYVTLDINVLFCLFCEKIIELVKQSKGWSSIEASTDSGENVMMNVSEEELYNIPTAEFVHRRGFINRQLTVYHVALNACADLKSKEVQFKSI